MRPQLIMERRGARWYACLGAAGGYGDTPEEATEQLQRRMQAYEQLFTARVP